MDNITLTELKSLKTPHACELCEKLNVEITPEADLEYMQSNLRLLKLKQVAHDQELSLTQDLALCHLGFSSSVEWKFWETIITKTLIIPLPRTRT